MSIRPDEIKVVPRGPEPGGMGGAYRAFGETLRGLRTTMGHDYEMADYNRSDLIFTKEMLLAEPISRTPLRGEGE